MIILRYFIINPTKIPHINERMNLICHEQNGFIIIIFLKNGHFPKKQLLWQ